MSDEATQTPADSATAQTRSGLIAVRRGLALVLMSMVVPGSAQLAAGNRKLGRIALRVWLSLLVLLLVIGIVALVMREDILGLVSNSIVLIVTQWLVLLVAISWSLLLLDAWRLADPRLMVRAGAVISGGLALTLAVAGTSIGWTVSGVVDSTRSAIEAMTGQGDGISQAQNGRYNVLLLGGDAGTGREGLRPDSITVASIDINTGRTVLLSLPRNMQRAPFPTSSPLHKLYPNGYYCPEKKTEARCYLNGINTLAVEHKSLFPGVKNPGVVATQGVVEEILGLKINYWVMIDIKGMEKLIDALGGVRIDVNERVPMGKSGTAAGVFGYIEKGKNQLLDGYHAVWFARSRENALDYDRMIRQKCVMNAMLKQMDPATVITKFQAIAEAGKQIAQTSLPSDQLGVMSKLALKAKTLPIASVSFSPPSVVKDTSNPDYALIRRVTAETIAASEALDASGGAAKSASSSTTTTSTSTSKSTSTADKNNTDDIAAVCKAS